MTAELMFEISNAYGRDDVLDFSVALIGTMMWRFEEEVEERQEDQIFNLIDSILPEPPYPWVIEWDRQLHKIITLVWSTVPYPQHKRCLW